MQINSACRNCKLIQSDLYDFRCSDCSLAANNSINGSPKSQQFNPFGSPNMNKSTVETVLMSIGMPASLKGFVYITDAVLLLDTPEWKGQKWTALYYKIAVLNNTTPSRVEKAIRNAFAITRSRPENYEMAAHYIGMTNCENSNSIMHLYKSICLEIEAAREAMKQTEESPAEPAAEAPPSETQQPSAHSYKELNYSDLKKLVQKTILELL